MVRIFEFLKRKKYKIGNRVLIIENKSRLSSIDRIKSVIVGIFAKEKLLFKFNKLVIMLYDGYVTSSEIKKWKKEEVPIGGEAFPPNIIRIDLGSLAHIEKNMPADGYADDLVIARLQMTMIHEAYHLLHFNQNLDVTLFKEKYEEKVLAGIEGLLESTNTFSDNVEQFRISITSFLGKIWIEGMAEFLEGLYNRKLAFDESNFMSLFARANLLAERTEKIFTSFGEARTLKAFNDKNDERMARLVLLLEKSLNEVTVHGSYDIGAHVLFSIRYLNPDIDDEKLMNMHIYQLILMYEKLMLGKGYRPTISLYSGKGIFDYKRAMKIVAPGLKK